MAHEADVGALDTFELVRVAGHGGDESDCRDANFPSCQ